MMNVIIADDP